MNIINRQNGGKFFWVDFSGGRVFQSQSGNTMCIYAMCYEWDERKNRETQRGHGGISFELAVGDKYGQGVD
jgi:hypothetical protein